MNYLPLPPLWCGSKPCRPALCLPWPWQLLHSSPCHYTNGFSRKLQPSRLQCQQLWVAQHTLPPGTRECAKNPGPTHTSWPGSLPCSTLQSSYSQLPHLHFIRVHPTLSAIPHQSIVMFLAIPSPLEMISHHFRDRHMWTSFSSQHTFSSLLNCPQRCQETHLGFICSFSKVV